jgi:hypothetical protein
MMTILYSGMFDFLEVLLTPLWALVGLVFLAIIFVLSKTIIKSAKKTQSGEKPIKSKSDFSREIEPYSDMPYVRITFDGKPPVYNKLTIERLAEVAADSTAKK